MRSDTRTVTIHARPEDVFAIVAEPGALPRWAIGFAKSVALTDDGWRVELASGTRVPIRYVTSRELGVVDFHIAPAPGAGSVAHARILANGDGTEVVFTQFQGDAPDDVFDAQVEAVARELVVLKALAETECPL